MDTKEQPIITLYRGWDEPGRYVWSPFVTKVEFRLRTSNISYKNAIGSPLSGPKGKIPYMEIAEPNKAMEVVPDSSLIVKNLINRALITDVNAELCPAEIGQDLAIRALMEDKLSFYLAHERWIRSYYPMRDHALWTIPYPIRIFIGLAAYRRNVRKLHDQGTGRFSDAEIRALEKEIWVAISGVLQQSQSKSKDGECFWVLGGKSPTEADATVFGFVVSVLVCDAGPESKLLIRAEFPVIVDYAERIHKRWFPDYRIWD